MYFNRSSKRSRRSWRSRPCCSVDWLEKRPAANQSQSSKTPWLLCRGNSQVQQNPTDSRRWSNPYKVSRSQAFSLTGRVNKADVSTQFYVTRIWYLKGLALLIFINIYIQGVFFVFFFFKIKNRNLNLQHPAATQTLKEKLPKSKYRIFPPNNT